MTAPTPAAMVLLPWSDEVLDQLAERLAERLVTPKAEAREMYIATEPMAEILGISRGKLHQLAAEADCPAIWVGDTRRWLPSETVAWFRARGRVAK